MTSTYNPKFHHRRSVRLRGYDYAKEGMYFVTICVQNRACLLGEIRDKVMILSPYGEIARREWENLPNRWPHIELGEFQIMPNHVHGILVIHHPAGTVTGRDAGATTAGATTRVAPTNGTLDEEVRLAVMIADNPESTGDAMKDAVGATLVVAPIVVALENEEQVPLLIADNPDSPTIPTGDAMKDAVGATLVVAPVVVALENEEQVPLLIADNLDSPTIPTGDAMKDVVGATLVVAPTTVVAPMSDTPPPETPFTKMQWATRPTVGQIVGTYKSTIITQCLKWQHQNRPGIWLEKIWQRGFHEHIILTAEAFDNISHYIIDNPENWEDDKFFEKQ